MSLMISIGSDTGVIMFAHNFALVPLCSLDKCSTSGKCCLDSVVGDAFENPGRGQVLISYCGLAPTQNGQPHLEWAKQLTLSIRLRKETNTSSILRESKLIRI